MVCRTRRSRLAVREYGELGLIFAATGVLAVVAPRARRAGRFWSMVKSRSLMNVTRHHTSPNRVADRHRKKFPSPISKCLAPMIHATRGFFGEWSSRSILNLIPVPMSCVIVESLIYFRL